MFPDVPGCPWIFRSYSTRLPLFPGDSPYSPTGGDPVATQRITAVFCGHETIGLERHRGDTEADQENHRRAADPRPGLHRLR
jgi:hypothetical protein